MNVDVIMCSDAVIGIVNRNPRGLDLGLAFGGLDLSLDFLLIAFV